MRSRLTATRLFLVTGAMFAMAITSGAAFLAGEQMSPVAEALLGDGQLADYRLWRLLIFPAGVAFALDLAVVVLAEAARRNAKSAAHAEAFAVLRTVAQTFAVVVLLAVAATAGLLSYLFQI